MHLASEYELLDQRFPYVLWPLKPLVYELELLPQDEQRDQTIDRCAATVRQLKRRCALVLTADSCIYFEADGTWEYSQQPPTGGIVVDVPPVPQCERPEVTEPGRCEAPDPPRGIELLRDDEAGKVWAAAKCGKKDRWRLVRHEYNAHGKIVREKEYEGNARGFYRHARKLGCDIDELPRQELQLPEPRSLYLQAVERELKGNRFSDEVYSVCCSWSVQYSISRSGKGWMVYVALEPWNSDPLQDPEIEFAGPFATKREVRDYLDERGLNSEVKF